MSQSSEAALQAAQTYQQYLVPALFEPMAHLLVERAALASGEHVLDVACGTGVVARLAATAVGTRGTVAALDLNPAMVHVARSVPVPEGAAISWHEGSALALPFPDAAFSVIFCQQGLQFFPDPVLALQEMRRVLAPAGRVVLVVMQALDRHPVYHTLNDAIKQHIGTGAFAAPFSLGDPNRLRSLLTAGGLPRIEIVPETFTVRFPLPDRFITLSVMGAAAAVPSFAQMDPASRGALVDAIRGDVAEVIDAHTQGDALIQTMHVYIGRGFK